MSALLLILAGLTILTVVGLWAGRRRVERHPRPVIKVACPVCNCRTLRRDARWPDLHQWEICPVCFWEDDDCFDGGGANAVSLTEARENYARFGAMEEGFIGDVRRPRVDEIC